MSIFKYINIGLLSLIVFLLPINQSFLSPLIGLWAISSLINKFIYKVKIKINKPLIALICFYLFLIIGLLWTDNFNSGTFDLEVKMSLIIFPLFFLFNDYSKTEIKWIIYAFISGLFVSSFILLYFATLRFLNWPSYSTFFYVELSYYLHPTYLSFYFITGIIILLQDLKTNSLALFNRWIIILIVTYLFCFNFLILSKIGIIVSVIVLFYFLSIWIYKSKQFWWGLIIPLLISGIFYVSYQKSDYVKQRFLEVVSSLTDKNKKEDSSTSIRVKIWDSAFKLIKKQPILGYGTGDVKDELVNQYRINKIEKAYHQKLNAHNQFLQILIALGIIGLLLFLLALYFSVFNGIKTKNMYIVLFVIISIFYMFTESILENQAGTIFFGLFFSLFNQKSFSKHE